MATVGDLHRAPLCHVKYQKDANGMFTLLGYWSSTNLNQLWLDAILCLIAAQWTDLLFIMPKYETRTVTYEA